MIYLLMGHSAPVSVTAVVLFIAFILAGIGLLGLLETLAGDDKRGDTGA